MSIVPDSRNSWSKNDGFYTFSALFYCTYSSLQFWSAVPRVWLCKALYLGSVKRWHWCSSEKDPPGLGTSEYKYYILHLSKEPYPKTASDWEVVKTDCFSPMYPDFNVWKKIGNSYSTVSSCTQQYLPTFFQTLKSAYSREILAVLTTSRSQTFLGNVFFERWRT